MGLAARFRHMIALQRGHLFGWLPVGMAVGIAVFFALRFEPSLLLILGVAIAGIAAFAATKPAPAAGQSRRPPINRRTCWVPASREHRLDGSRNRRPLRAGGFLPSHPMLYGAAPLA